MLRVKLNENVEVSVGFNHILCDEGDPFSDFYGYRFTECYILSGAVGTKDEEKVKIGEGEAKCNPLDNYCKRTGRKIALKRALEDAGIMAGDRRTVWESYGKLTNGKW